ncbi:MAG: hypothetical protein IT440_11570 [Phycisphaeraceae bacterium]|nr:hypothetical protein [Phycisphaeraceae bacterium]
MKVGHCRLAGMFLWVATLVPGLQGVVYGQPSGEDRRAKIGVVDVKISPMLVEVTGNEGKAKIGSLGRAVEAMDGRLIDRLHNTRKFRVFARSDIDALLKEQGLMATLGDPNDPKAAQGFKLAGIQYVVQPTVDDFQDYNEKVKFTGTGREASKRVIRLGVVVKIYDPSTGETLETASLRLGDDPEDPDYKLLVSKLSEPTYASTKDGNLTDDMLVGAVEIMARRVALRVVDVIYPAKVLSRTGEHVLINRGDGTGMVSGQIWNVYATGQMMVDPDTGVAIAAEEVQIGVVRVTEVEPLFSRAVVVEDNGIAKAQVLRRAKPK